MVAKLQQYIYYNPRRWQISVIVYSTLQLRSWGNLETHAVNSSGCPVQFANLAAITIQNNFHAASGWL